MKNILLFVFVMMSVFLISCSFVSFELINQDNRSTTEQVRCVNSSTIEVHFCDIVKDCADSVSKLIESANSSIKILMYSINNEKIIDSLINAKQKGIDVILIVDKSQSKQIKEEEQLIRLINAGIKIIYADPKRSGIMHNKVIIIDNFIVSTGSFNYTNNADLNNDENLIIFYDKNVTLMFLKYFDELRERYEMQ